jgi:hypothetical protein
MGDFSDDYGGYDILGLYEQRDDDRRAQRAKLLTLPKPTKQEQGEPVAWDGYNLDDMCEAFERVIEEHFYRKHPFHDPVNKDAMIALRILRGFIPYMKHHTTPQQRKPLTDEEIMAEHLETDVKTYRKFKEWQAAHGIKENT